MTKLSRTGLQTNAATRFPDQLAEAIMPQDSRDQAIDESDSHLNLTDDDFLLHNIFNINRSYISGDVVYYNNEFYIFNQAHVGAWDASHVDIYKGIKAWVTATDYKVDYIVIQSNNLYKCIVAHTSTTFSADIANNYWVQIGSTTASDAAFSSAWEGDTTTPASKNALFDYLIQLLNINGGTMAGDIDMSNHDLLNVNNINATSLDYSGTINIGAIDATILNIGTGSGNTNINIGTSGTNTIQIGNSNSTVNILGSVIYENVTNLEVSDKLFTVNKGGVSSSAVGAGFEIEEGGAIAGYIKTTGGRDGFLFKAPANAADSSFIFSATAARSYTFQDKSYTIADDSVVVHLAGAETISGQKTFSADIVFSGTTRTISSVTGNINTTTFSSGATITLSTVGGSATSGGVIIASDTSNISNISGTRSQLTINGTFAPTSGAGIFNSVLSNVVINQTGATGLISLFNATPTLVTSVTGILAGFTSDISDAPAGGGQAYNFYGLGTAPNYFNGNIIAKKSIISDSKQTYASGSSVIIASQVRALYVNPSSAIASLTITMPASPVDGEEILLSFGGIITSGTVVTALTLSGNSGQAILGGSFITSASAGDGYTLKWEASTNLWRIF
jgi:hypothetical protein